MKVGDLIKIDRPEFTSVAYGLLVQYYENGWWQLYQKWDWATVRGICQQQKQNGWR